MSTFNQMSRDAKAKTAELYDEAKDKMESIPHQFTEAASNLYVESKKKINNLEDSVEEYSEELIEKMKQKPLTSLLIAAGIGFLLSHLLKK